MTNKMTNKRAARSAMTREGKAYDDFVRNPPKKYRSVFRQIKQADRRSDRHVRQSKSALRNLSRNLNALDRLAGGPRSGIRGTGGRLGTSYPRNRVVKFKRKPKKNFKTTIKNLKKRTRWIKEDMAKQRVNIRETLSLAGKMKKGMGYKRGWKNPYQRKGKQPRSKVVKFKRKRK